MEERKTDFAKFLDELGCSGHGTKGQDYDWLWESEAGPFLDWLCRHITTSNMLTSEEITKWKKISEDDILQGKNLENALENIETEDKSVENENIAEIREELNVRQAAVADLQKVKTCLNNTNGRLSISLNAFEHNLEASKMSLGEEQRKLLRLNSELNECLEKQRGLLKTVQGQNSLSLDFAVLLKENDSVLVSLKSLSSKRIDVRPLRDIEEFDALASEIHRLRSTTVNQEQNAQHERQNAQHEATVRQQVERERDLIIQQQQEAIPRLLSMGLTPQQVSNALSLPLEVVQKFID